jgi:hypothetical protein
MTSAALLFEKLTALPGAKRSTMFGCPCAKVANGKAAFFYWKNDQALVFKLTGQQQQEALSLDGAHVFQPKPERPAMTGWIQVPLAHQGRYQQFAEWSLLVAQQATKAQ